MYWLHGPMRRCALRICPLSTRSLHEVRGLRVEAVARQVLHVGIGDINALALDQQHRKHLRYNPEIFCADTSVKGHGEVDELLNAAGGGGAGRWRTPVAICRLSGGGAVWEISF